MIKIENLSKKYDSTYILKDINLELPRFGIVVIFGPSGSGKTTLLNCISGLLPYEGSINVDGKRLEAMSDNDISDFRLSNYGFIFQDFKLFENETVIDNVLLPLEMKTNLSDSRKRQKCRDLLSLVGLKDYRKQIVKKLSGGEKQRVAIARSLANDPSIILADEPTGALDRKNSEEIMKILEKVSLSSLVIIVSHDRELVDKYADIVIEMEDGNIKHKRYKQRHKHEEFLPVMKNGFSNKKQCIPSRFLLRHTYHAIKQRKWRTLICNIVTSLGLIGVGVAISLSSSISSNIKDAYSSLIDQSKVMVSVKKDNSNKLGAYAGSYYEAKDIAGEYDDYVIDVGVSYVAEFEAFFPDVNSFALTNTSSYFPIDGISVRNINEFEWLECCKENIYPTNIEHLEDDEVILGLSINMIQDICFGLKIVRTVSSLSEYLQNNDLYMYFDLANTSWEYSDQQIVNVKGFTLEKEVKIYHSNHLWNEYMLEERMRFPTSDNLVEQVDYPWVMRKFPYFYLKDNVDEFLSLTHYDKNFDPYILEIANTTYFPWLMLDKDVKDIRRIMFLSNNQNNIPLRYVDYFYQASSNINNPTFGNAYGYSIYPSSLMMGFSRFTYFSFDEDLLIETLDANKTLSLSMNESLELPSGIESGHFSKSMGNGVIFETQDNNLSSGRMANNLDEIVISSALYDKLKRGNNEDILYISSTINEKPLGNNLYLKFYKTVPLKVTGIKKSQKLAIYHNSDWTMSFFQSRIGVSSFYLGVTDIAFSLVDESASDETIKELKKAFPDYEIINPLSDINKSVDEVCKYLGFALVAFSFIATLISTLLLSICNYLHILEERKEISLARCLGATRNESKKFLFTHSLVMCFISFILSSVELLSISFMTSYIISDTLSSNVSFSFNPFSLLAMLCLSLVISLLSTSLISRKITKLNPLIGLRY